VRAADKIVDRADLAARLAPIRAAGGKVVFTCGVFDLLHVGHVRYLEYARGLGAALVVGVNSDASARQLAKGPGRPIVPEEERAELVAALASVDYVCLFPELRPNESIRIIRPDIHVKDTAYEGSVLPEASAVEEVGGVIIFAPHISGRSSSALAQRIAAELR
jgi:D-beta-D-heptose 7-phosphate kinase/D-beta-D-heptose 1-phosphate adenosyltransferase